MFNLGRAATASNQAPSNVAEPEKSGRTGFRASSSMTNRRDAPSRHKSGSASSESGRNYRHNDEDHPASDIMDDGTSADKKKRHRRRRKHKSRIKVEPVHSGAGPHHNQTTVFKTSSQNRHSSSVHCGRTPTKACPASMGGPTSKKQHDAPMMKRDLYFSLHCERVGTGSAYDAVARVTLVNWENEIVMDTFVKVPVPVTDFYETGITAEDVNEGTNPHVQSFSVVRQTVESTLRGKILIGHHVEQHLQALGLTHPWTDLRDCAHFAPFANEEVDGVTSEITWVVRSLDELREQFLQKPLAALGDASRPIQYCVTALDLYKLFRKEWEESLIARVREQEANLERLQHSSPVTPVMMPAPNAYGSPVSSPPYPHVRNNFPHPPQHYLGMLDQPENRFSNTNASKEGIFSLHCETVRTANSEALARVTMVNSLYETIYDCFIQVPVPVVDFRQSGITAEDVSPLDNPLAVLLPVARQHVDALLRGCHLLVGYKVDQNLKALGLAYPWMQVRDTAYFKPFMFQNLDVVSGKAVVVERSLDELSLEILQVPLAAPGNRNRPTDACITTLKLYMLYCNEWEAQEACLMQQQQKVAEQIASPIAQPLHFGTSNQTPTSPMMACYMTPRVLPSPQVQSVGVTPQVQSVGVTPQRSSSSWFVSLGRKQVYGQEHQRQNIATVNGTTSSACASLSPQAFQVLQEETYVDSPLASQDNASSYYVGSSSYLEGSTLYDGSSSCTQSNSAALDDTSRSGTVWDVESVASSLHDDTLSIPSADLGPTESSISVGVPSMENQVDFACAPAAHPKTASSSTSWFRFGSRKQRYATASSCVSMMAVQEAEELEEMAQTHAAPLSSSSNDVLQVSIHRSTAAASDASSSKSVPESSIVDPPVPRSWFGFRRRSNSPGRKHSSGQRRRSCSPSNIAAESQVEIDADALSNSGRSEVLSNMGSDAIEVALSNPEKQISIPSGEPHFEPAAISAPFSPGRNSSSWFGFRRSKSPGAKQSQDASLAESTAKESDAISESTSELDSEPDTFLTTAQSTPVMEDDWLQEVVNAQSVSTLASDELSSSVDLTWLAKDQNLIEGSTLKPGGVSKPQSSWFGFKRSKTSSPKVSRLAAASDLGLTDPSQYGKFTDSIADNSKPDAKRATDTWEKDAGVRCAQSSHLGPSWYLSSNPSICNSPSTFEGISGNSGTILDDTDHESFYSNVLMGRARLLTESTLPTVSTEELEEDDSQDYGDEFVKGMEQNFAFLEI